MKVFAIVLNWNGEKYFTKCLDSLQKLSHRPEIVFVDNNSTDRSVDVVRRKYPGVKILKNSKNFGYAAGNNVGLEFALKNGADLFWIVNPDVTVASDCLDKILLATQNHPRSGIFSPKIYFAKGYEFHKNYTASELGRVIWSAGGFMDWANLIASHRGVDEVDIGQYNTDTICDFATGASILIRREVIEKIGFIDPKYYLYYEENDFCQRTLKTGFQITYVAEAICWHANAQATGIGSSLVDYYTTRNRLLFGWRWAPFRTKLALLRESIRHLFNGRKWQKLGVVDFYLNHFGVGSYVDGNNHR